MEMVILRDLKGKIFGQKCFQKQFLNMKEQFPEIKRKCSILCYRSDHSRDLGESF